MDESVEERLAFDGLPPVTVAEPVGRRPDFVDEDHERFPIQERGGARRQRPLECVDGPVVERLAIEIRPLDERPGPLSAVDVGELDA